MSKPRIIGMQTPYTPNARRDKHFHKKAYQRPREIAQRALVAGQKVKTKEAEREQDNL